MRSTRYREGDMVKYTTGQREFTATVTKVKHYGRHGSQYELDNGHTVRDKHVVEVPND